MTLKQLRKIIRPMQNVTNICANDQSMRTGYPGNMDWWMGSVSTIESRGRYGDTRLPAYTPNCGDHKI